MNDIEVVYEALVLFFIEGFPLVDKFTVLYNTKKKPVKVQICKNYTT